MTNVDLKTGYINKNINSYKVKFFPARSTGFGSKPTRGIKDEKGVCAIRCTYASSRWELSGNTAQCWFPNLKKNVESLQNVDDYDIRLTLLWTGNNPALDFKEMKNRLNNSQLWGGDDGGNTQPVNLSQSPRAPSSSAAVWDTASVKFLSLPAPSRFVTILSFKFLHKPAFCKHSESVQSYLLHIKPTAREAQLA